MCWNTCSVVGIVVEKIIMIIQALLRWKALWQVYWIVLVQERARHQHRAPVSECSSDLQFQCMSYYTRTQKEKKMSMYRTVQANFLSLVTAAAETRWPWWAGLPCGVCKTKWTINKNNDLLEYLVLNKFSIKVQRQVLEDKEKFLQLWWV